MNFSDIILYTGRGNQNLEINANSEPNGYIYSHNNYGSRNYYRNMVSSATLAMVVQMACSLFASIISGSDLKAYLISPIYSLTFSRSEECRV